MTDDKGALARTVDSHGGIHYKDEAAAARHIVRQNVKDKDALESMRGLRQFLDAFTVSALGEAYETFDAAIAAWEKERALSEERRKYLLLYDASDKLLAKHGEDLTALRAAVEKVRDELQAYPVSIQLKGWADALDAALRGGA